MKKTLHPKSIERSVKLHISHLGIPEIKRASNDSDFLTSDLSLIGGRVVLHLVSRDVGDLRVSVIPLVVRVEAHVFYQASKGRVSDCDFLFLRKFFVNSPDETLAVFVKFSNKFRVDFLSVISQDL
jgi:hypothetical protein